MDFCVFHSFHRDSASSLSSKSTDPEKEKFSEQVKRRAIDVARETRVHGWLTLPGSHVTGPWAALTASCACIPTRHGVQA